MLNRLGRAVSAANPASHADKRMDAATGKLSIPRFQVMSPAQLDAFTKAGPPNGVFVYTMSPDGSEDELQQWVKDHWEVVGKVYIGENAKTDDIVKRVTPAAFSMGAGGSGVGVAPRQPGDPSIVEPMQTVFSTAVSVSPDFGVNTIHLPDGVRTAVMTWTVPGGFLPSTIAFIYLRGSVLISPTLDIADSVDFEVEGEGNTYIGGSQGPGEAADFLELLPGWSPQVPSPAPHLATGDVWTLFMTAQGNDYDVSWDYANGFPTDGNVEPLLTFMGTGS